MSKDLPAAKRSRVSCPKLTAIQTAALHRFADGQTAHRASHPVSYDSYLWHEGMVTIRAGTIHALLGHGLIEDTEKPEWRWRGSRYRITEAGKSLAKAGRMASAEPKPEVPGD